MNNFTLSIELDVMCEFKPYTAVGIFFDCNKYLDFANIGLLVLLMTTFRCHEF